MRRGLVIVLLLGCLASPAWAGKAKDTPEPGTSVEMPFLIAPMSKDGKLLGYAYISSKLQASTQAAAISVREKLAFIQDANVRDVNSRSVGRADDPTKVDSEQLCQRLAANAKRIVGETRVVKLTITQVQFAPLHPSPSTLNMAPGSAPQPPAAAANVSAPATAPQGDSAATQKPPADSTH